MFSRGLEPQRPRDATTDKRGIYHVFIYLDLTLRYIKVAKGVYIGSVIGIKWSFARA